VGKSMTPGQLSGLEGEGVKGIKPRNQTSEKTDDGHDVDDAYRMDRLAEALQPFIDEFNLRPSKQPNQKEEHTDGHEHQASEDMHGEDNQDTPMWRKIAPARWLRKQISRGNLLALRSRNSSSVDLEHSANATPMAGSIRSAYPPAPSISVSRHDDPRGSPLTSPTVWEVLHSVPRDYLDAFQPLIRLSALFRGATVPAIDYHTAKLGLLTALINENRSRAPEEFMPASTAFVTFYSPADARKAVKTLPSHPKNPLTCLVEPAPEFGDLDWSRTMTSTFTGEFIKDWVVDVGVWAFTCFWIIPVRHRKLSP
jgi:hypothetical protein